MKNFKTVIKNIDVAPLVDEIEQANLWQSKSLRTCEMMGQTEIILQYNNLEEMIAGNCDYKETVGYPAIYQLKKVREFIFRLMHTVNGERLGRAFITCLAPGKRIAPHKDTDAGFPAGYFTRYHLCLKDCEGTEFHCGDEVFRPDVGDLFTFNNLITHSVENNGDSERWTMVIDIKKPTRYTPDGSLEEMLKKNNARVITTI